MDAKYTFDADGLLDRIAQLQNSRGLTATQFASEIGLPRQNISNWMRGQSKPTLDAICRIIKRFSVPAEWLLFGDETNRGNIPALPEPSARKSSSSTDKFFDTYEQLEPMSQAMVRAYADGLLKEQLSRSDM